MSTQGGAINFSEYRCYQCRKLLFKAVMIAGTVQVKCKKCGQLIVFCQLETSNNESPFSILVDEFCNIVSIDTALCGLIGKQPSDLIGNSLQSLSAHLGLAVSAGLIDSMEKPNHQNQAYEMHETMRLVDDEEATIRWQFINHENAEYVLVKIYPGQAELSPEVFGWVDSPTEDPVVLQPASA